MIILEYKEISLLNGNKGVVDHACVRQDGNHWKIGNSLRLYFQEFPLITV